MCGVVVNRRGLVGKPEESTWEVRVTKDPNRSICNWRWELHENGEYRLEYLVSLVPGVGFSTSGYSLTHAMALKAAARHLKRLLKRRDEVQAAREEATTYPL